MQDAPCILEACQIALPLTGEFCCYGVSLLLSYCWSMLSLTLTCLCHKSRSDVAFSILVGSACRLRQLVRRLETSVGVRPWPKPIKSPGHGPQSYSTLYYMGLKKRSTQMTATTLSRASNNSVNLNGPVNEFRHLVMSWDDWQEGMDVVVRHMKQKDLPPFVFTDGESGFDTLLCNARHGFCACHSMTYTCNMARSKGLLHNKVTFVLIAATFSDEHPVFTHSISVSQ